MPPVWATSSATASGRLKLSIAEDHRVGRRGVFSRCDGPRRSSAVRHRVVHRCRRGDHRIPRVAGSAVGRSVSTPPSSPTCPGLARLSAFGRSEPYCSSVGCSVRASASSWRARRSRSVSAWSPPLLGGWCRRSSPAGAPRSSPVSVAATGPKSHRRRCPPRSSSAPTRRPPGHPPTRPTRRHRRRRFRRRHAADPRDRRPQPPGPTGAPTRAFPHPAARRRLAAKIRRPVNLTLREKKTLALIGVCTAVRGRHRRCRRLLGVTHARRRPSVRHALGWPAQHACVSDGAVRLPVGGCDGDFRKLDPARLTRFLYRSASR